MWLRKARDRSTIVQGKKSQTDAGAISFEVVAVVGGAVDFLSAASHAASSEGAVALLTAVILLSGMRRIVPKLTVDLSR